MDNCITKKMLQPVSADIDVFDSIRIEGIKEDSEREIFECAAIEGKETSTFVRCMDEKILVGNYSGSEKSEEHNLSNGYINAFKKDGVTYPSKFIVDVFPKENLKTAQISDLSVIDKYMINLERIAGSCGGDMKGKIEYMLNAPQLSYVMLYPGNTPEQLTGDIATLGKLINIGYINCRGSFVYGDVAEMLEAMIENGRTKQKLKVMSFNSMMYITLSDSSVQRINDQIVVSGQTKTICGWVIDFSNNEWSVESVVTDSSDTTDPNQ